MSAHFFDSFRNSEYPMFCFIVLSKNSKRFLCYGTWIATQVFLTFQTNSCRLTLFYPASYKPERLDYIEGRLLNYMFWAKDTFATRRFLQVKFVFLTFLALDSQDNPMPPYRIVHIDVGKRICFPHDNSLNFPLLYKQRIRWPPGGNNPSRSGQSCTRSRGGRRWLLRLGLQM